MVKTLNEQDTRRLLTFENAVRPDNKYQNASLFDDLRLEVELKQCLSLYDSLSDKSVGFGHILNLMDSQKLAYANKVIGEDNDITKIAQEKYPFQYDTMEPKLKSENDLMARQRERNKL